MKRLSPVALWFLLACFVGGIVAAQQYLREQGSDLIPGAGGNFTLESAEGPVSLSDFRGQVVAIYFGYMSCPDICPTSLWNLSQAVSKLDDEQAQSVTGIFISLDPERDTPQALAIFSRGYNSRFIGVTGSREMIDKVARQYGVIYEKVELDNSAMGYVIDHSSVTYLIDRDGVLRYYAPHNTQPEDLYRELLKLLD